MSRYMWILAGVLAVMAIAMIYQVEFGGGVHRPWAECKENMVTQMLTGACTPRTGVLGGGSFPRTPTGSAGSDAPQDPYDSGTAEIDSSPLVEQR